MTTISEKPTTDVHARAKVLFDGDCALCQKSIKILKQLDWLERLEYVDVRNTQQEVLQNPLVAPAPLLEQMHLLTPAGTKIYGGFLAFRWMAWRLPLVVPFAPLMYLPGVPWLGNKVYLWIARNRFRLVPCQGGACTIQRKEDK